MTGFQAALAAAQSKIGDLIAQELSDEAGPVAEAMRYAVVGGKALRAFLVYEGARLHGAADRADGAALAIEAIHAYSLVHDDLPCMDDDDLRRGQPTVHRKWDEATAVLAGDALQALAFGAVLRSGASDAARLDLAARLSRAAGVGGMVGGQAMDIAAESAGRALTLEEIVRLQSLKTGALIEWAAAAGAVIAGADPAPLSAYGAALGQAFQIADDLLDVEGDPDKAGKRLQKDAGAGKATFVSLLGADGARARARDLVQAADAALRPYGEAAGNLREAAQFVIAREF